MKKKVLSLFIICFFIISVVSLLTACSNDKNETKKERINTATIVNVYQDSNASVYVEVTGFEHTDYENISDSGYDACTLEFSINDGDWFVGNFIQDFYNESGIGVYGILNTQYQQGDTKITSYNVLMTGQTIFPGEITISVRIPESDKYYASVGSEKISYTLKQYIQISLNDKLAGGIYSLGSIGASEAKEERYAFYNENNDPYNIKIGKFHSEENSNGYFDYILCALSVEEEATILTELNLEYKVLNYNQNYINSIEGHENIDMLSIESDENDSVYITQDWTNELNLNPTKLWEYENNGFKYESIVFLARQKADENTVQSRAICFECLISFEEIL